LTVLLTALLAVLAPVPRELRRAADHTASSGLYTCKAVGNGTISPHGRLLAIASADGTARL
jgi:hypothetical protein